MVGYLARGKELIMFIAHKSNVLLNWHDTEWMCRMEAKGLNGPKEYWTWLDSVTTEDERLVKTYDFSGETDYTIVEVRDEDIPTRLGQLRLLGYESAVESKEEHVYNIKFYATKRDSEIEGVKSHFIGDDATKDARLLSEEWIQIRKMRNRLIAETDWMMLSDTGTASTAWKNYRKALRDIPSSQDSAKVFSDIDWPDKPSS